MLPENLERNYELIAGEIVEKKVSNSRASRIAAWFIMKLGLFVDDHELGNITATDGGYIVSGERYIPDAAFLSKSRCPVSNCLSKTSCRNKLPAHFLSRH
jgi:Uma2 family endonuclease